MKMEFVKHSELFDIFDCGTSPKLMKVLESQGIPYMVDGKGKPFTTRSALNKAFPEGKKEQELAGFDA